MKIITAEDVGRLLTYRDLVEALRATFAEGVSAPTRHHHTIARTSGADGTLLLMPAWTGDGSGPEKSYLGVKIVTVNPDNNLAGQPAVMGVFMLADGTTGEPLAVIDGQALTVWRTACASALAADYLAREDASSMVMVGAGKLAPHLVRAHAAVRPIREVAIWNRSPEKAEALAASLREEGLNVTATGDLETAVAAADVVCAATISSEPLIKGRWLAEGAHLDLVGAFTPKLRECDDDAVRRARLFVDTFDGALAEGGDLVQPLRDGVIARDDIEADLAMLARGDHSGRGAKGEITLFKSTGTALEDLAAGCLVYEKAIA